MAVLRFPTEDRMVDNELEIRGELAALGIEDSSLLVDLRPAP